MARFSKLICLGLGFGILTAVIGMLTSHSVAAAPGAQNVVVTNTPLPVQVGNFPSTQNVTGTVNVGNFPTAQGMNVTNPQTQPVPTFDAQNQPFGTAMNIILADGSIRGDATFTVPGGQRLIIEYVAGSACLPVGQKAIYFNVETVVGNKQVDYILPAIPEGTLNYFGCDYFVVGQPVRLYAEPNSTVDLGILRSDTNSTGSTSSYVAVSGHLVNTQ